jgi:hypothetical protein
MPRAVRTSGFPGPCLASSAGGVHTLPFMYAPLFASVARYPRAGHMGKLCSRHPCKRSRTSATVPSMTQCLSEPMTH